MCGLFLRHWLNGLQTNLPARSLENDDIIVAVGIRGKNQDFFLLKAIAPTEAFDSGFDCFLLEPSCPALGPVLPRAGTHKGTTGYNPNA